jgi:uncharacterized protein YjbI with pentapeptide repeats
VVTEPKLLWDWLELLIIPIVLGAGALLFNQQARKGEQRQRQNEAEIAQDRAREEALQRYLDTMQELILDKGLRRSKPWKDPEIRDVSRARTLTVLRSLDGNRKGQVVRFLHEADLIGKVVEEQSGKTRVIEAIIDLRTADLTNADLTLAYLRGADLNYADLSGAILRVANLTNADLTLADLRDADLSDANLFLAKLSGADLRVANLSEAYLRYADLHGAIILDEQLAQANTLVDATMPNGKVMTQERWEEFKQQHR